MERYFTWGRILNMGEFKDVFDTLIGSEWCNSSREPIDVWTGVGKRLSSMAS